MISTAVVMAGLAATAGSPPNFLTSKGNPAPIIAEEITWKQMDKEIIKAIK